MAADKKVTDAPQHGKNPDTKKSAPTSPAVKRSVSPPEPWPEKKKN